MIKISKFNTRNIEKSCNLKGPKKYRNYQKAHAGMVPRN